MPAERNGLSPRSSPDRAFDPPIALSRFHVCRLQLLVPDLQGLQDALPLLSLLRGTLHNSRAALRPRARSVPPFPPVAGRVTPFRCPLVRPVASDLRQAGARADALCAAGPDSDAPGISRPPPRGPVMRARSSGPVSIPDCGRHRPADERLPEGQALPTCCAQRRIGPTMGHR